MRIKSTEAKCRLMEEGRDRAEWQDDIFADPNLVRRIMIELKQAGDISEQEADQLKEKYFKEYPLQIDNIKIISGILRIVANQKELSTLKGETRGKKLPDAEFRVLNKRIRRLAGLLSKYNNQVTSFVLDRREEKGILSNFWQLFEEAYQEEYSDSQAAKMANSSRVGILSQVAVFEAFRELDLEPRLAKEDEDARFNIDLWAKDGRAFQIKNYNKNEPLIFGRDKSVDAVREYYDAPLDMAPKISDFIRHGMREMVNYGHKTQQDVKPFFILAPNSMFDPVTGKPNEALVDFFRQRFPLDKQE